LYNSLHDSALWIKVIEGNQDALAFIYNKHFQSLYRYGMKLHPDGDLVKDTIHDLFAGIWLGRERLSVTDSIRYYLLASLKRQINRKLERASRLYEYRVTNTSATSSHEEVLIAAQIHNERKQKLEKVINGLPPRQREVLYLRFYEGLDTQAVAKIMSLSVNSTYVLLSKALGYLKKNRNLLILCVLLNTL
jgi:RNA polymerase sigma factor (sigma-70 family)